MDDTARIGGVGDGLEATRYKYAAIRRFVTLFAPLESAARDSLKVDGIAKAGSTLLRQGLLKSMSTASNPQLLDALFNLMTAPLDHGKEVWKDPKILASEVNFLTQQLEQRQVYDMKPYARKLRERYPAQP